MRESWGSTKPKGAMKVKAFRLVGLGGIPGGLSSGRTTGPSRSQLTRRSKSVRVGTRKMVNYA